MMEHKIKTATNILALILAGVIVYCGYTGMQDGDMFPEGWKRITFLAIGWLYVAVYLAGLYMSVRNRQQLK